MSNWKTEYICKSTNQREISNERGGWFLVLIVQPHKSLPFWFLIILCCKVSLLLCLPKWNISGKSTLPAANNPFAKCIYIALKYVFNVLLKMQDLWNSCHAHTHLPLFGSISILATNSCVTGPGRLDNYSGPTTLCLDKTAREITGPKDIIQKVK